MANIADRSWSGFSGWTLAAGAALLLSVAVPAIAADPQAPPSAANGKGLAERFCRNCHLTGADEAASVPVGPPSFATIANRPEQSAERIKGMLIAPHPPMPDMHLTNDEMQDLIAYIDSLRKRDLKPLLPPPGAPKPKYPTPG